jgi:hypothetical protein
MTFIMAEVKPSGLLLDSCDFPTTIMISRFAFLVHSLVSGSCASRQARKVNLDITIVVENLAGVLKA